MADLLDCLFTLHWQFLAPELLAVYTSHLFFHGLCVVPALAPGFGERSR